MRLRMVLWSFAFVLSAGCGVQVEDAEQAVSSCRPGFHLECDPGCEVPPCIKPHCTCEPNALTAPPSAEQMAAGR